jgi:hypothetical protein
LNFEQKKIEMNMNKQFLVGSIALIFLGKWICSAIFDDFSERNFELI